MKLDGRKYGEKRVKSVAAKLSGLLFINNLAYSHRHEAWLFRTPGTDRWNITYRDDVVEFAGAVIAGMTNSIADYELTEKCLIQIERWAIASDDAMGYFSADTSSNPWRPMCLLETDISR